MQADSHLSESGAHTPVVSYPSRPRETLWVLFASIYPQHDSGTLWSERDSYLTCPDGAYGNFWWLNNVEIGDLMARGVFGQMIYINRAAELTIVKLSTWPDYLIENFKRDSLVAFAAIRSALECTPEPGRPPRPGTSASRESSAGRLDFLPDLFDELSSQFPVADLGGQQLQGFHHGDIRFEPADDHLCDRADILDQLFGQNLAQRRR